MIKLQLILIIFIMFVFVSLTIFYKNTLKKIKELHKNINDNLDLQDSNILEVLENANLITTNKNTSLFDFNASPGDLFIFDESGLHKGSKPSSNERIVLRYTYSTKVN